MHERMAILTEFHSGFRKGYLTKDNSFTPFKFSEYCNKIIVYQLLSSLQHYK